MKKKVILVCTALVVPGGLFVLAIWGLTKYLKKYPPKIPFLGV
jgi:hypothetical protein